MASLVISEAWNQRALLYVASLFSTPNLSIKVTSATGPLLTTSSGKTFQELPAIAKLLVPESLSGRDVQQQAEVSRWLAWGFVERSDLSGVAAVETQLTERSYIAGHSFTVADAVAYFSIARSFQGSAAASATRYPSVWRWLTQLSREPGYSVFSTPGAPAPLTVQAPPQLSLFSSARVSTPAAPAKVAAAAADKVPKPSIPVVVAAKSVAPSPVSASASSADAPPQSAPPQPEAAAPKVRPLRPCCINGLRHQVHVWDVDRKGRRKRRLLRWSHLPLSPRLHGLHSGYYACCPLHPMPPPTCLFLLRPVSEIELKVGFIVEAWVHPTADKLYCEKIDLGEAAGPREIASGLREHIKLEDMQGRRVVVVTNLKPRPLAGFTSNGEEGLWWCA